VVCGTTNTFLFSQEQAPVCELFGVRQRHHFVNGRHLLVRVFSTCYEVQDGLVLAFDETEMERWMNGKEIDRTGTSLGRREIKEKNMLLLYRRSGIHQREDKRPRHP
jgi:hypothetical protein